MSEGRLLLAELQRMSLADYRQRRAELIGMLERRHVLDDFPQDVAWLDHACMAVELPRGAWR